MLLIFLWQYTYYVMCIWVLVTKPGLVLKYDTILTQLIHYVVYLMYVYTRCLNSLFIKGIVKFICNHKTCSQFISISSITPLLWYIICTLWAKDIPLLWTLKYQILANAYAGGRRLQKHFRFLEISLQVT